MRFDNFLYQFQVSGHLYNSRNLIFCSFWCSTAVYTPIVVNSSEQKSLESKFNERNNPVESFENSSI